MGNEAAGRKVVVALAAVMMACAVCLGAEGGGEAEKEVAARAQPKPVVDARTIVQLVFGLNPEVVSARYAMEAAEFQFKDFERNLSQFTPVVVRSEVLRDDRRPIEWQRYRAAVGAEKEFFDGSSVFGGVGHRGDFGDNDQGNSQFVETQVSFPVAGSNTTLRRITDRSREENEMFNSRLDYIDTVRDRIQDAQLAYFWMLVDLERRSLIVESLDFYNELLKSERTAGNGVEGQHINGEVQGLQFEALRIAENINSRLLDVQLAIGLDELTLDQVNVMDMHAKDYYGKGYISRDREQLLREANLNDIKIKVLENAKQNSIEKRRLADEGKWDVFFDLAGEVDFATQGSFDDRDGYFMLAGLRMQKIDSTLLYYSRSRAVAEINKYDALMEQQRLKTQNRIDREWTIAKSRRQQIDQLLQTIEARRQVFEQKKRDYAAGRETVDTLIGARNQYRWSQMDVCFSLGEFYESVTWLDHACGVYFEELGIGL